MEINQLKKPILISIKNRIKMCKPVAIYISAFAALILIFSVIFVSTLLNSPKIYNGVYIGDKHVGGFTKEELLEYLKQNYNDILDTINLSIISENFSRNYTAAETGLVINFDEMTERAWAQGRTGSKFERLAAILRLKKYPVNIKLAVDDNTEAFNNFIGQLCKDVFREVIPPNIVILEDRAILYTGVSGQEADEKQLREDIINSVVSMQPGEIKVRIKEKLPPSIDYQATLATLNRDPVNAQFIKTSRTTYEITPHETGRYIDSKKLLEIISYVESRQNQEYEEILLPVEFIQPLVTKEELEEKLFRDVLASYTTYYKTDTQNNINRGINIGLAAESIDGTILLPGEEFSFNEIVGPRTPQKGYKIAHVYVQGQIRDGTGGGVCQVSTTLYNAVLRANLQVNERHNHMFTVGYVPLGTDAAVSYGYADLKFTNTSGHPLMIKADVNKNSIGFRIVSTNDYPDLKVKLATKTISTTPRTTIYLDDPNLPSGTVIVSEKGMDGYVVDTYMKIYNGQTLLREEKLHRSVYQMLPQKIIRGTGPVSEAIE
ncbi:MAG: hypothetical protein GX184_03705 [Clostridiaceae bacterium]|nr:hypothetical protein [Clostridiaceae bacterium]